jgi:hypothetical protein
VLIRPAGVLDEQVYDSLCDLVRILLALDISKEAERVFWVIGEIKIFFKFRIM